MNKIGAIKTIDGFFYRRFHGFLEDIYKVKFRDPNPKNFMQKANR
jgi:hypothetical protein